MRARVATVIISVTVVAACTSSGDGSAERRRLLEVRRHTVFEIPVAGSRPKNIIYTSGRSGDREASTNASREWTLDGADDVVFADFVKAAIGEGVEVTQLSCIDAQDTVTGLLQFSDGPALVIVALRKDPPALSAHVSLGHSSVRPQPAPVGDDEDCPAALREAVGVA